MAVVVGKRLLAVATVGKGRYLVIYNKISDLITDSILSTTRISSYLKVLADENLF